MSKNTLIHSQLPEYTQVQEDELISFYVGQSAGSAVIFNTDTYTFRQWNGNSFESSVCAGAESLGYGNASATKFLRGDLTWATPATGSSIPMFPNASATDITITAAYSGIVCRKLAIASGKKVTIESTARLRIL